MMKLNNFLAVILFALIFSPVSGQETYYDLEKCITTGLERNFSIRVARNMSEIASNNHTLGNAGFLPTIDANSRYGGSLENISRTYADTSFTGVQKTTGVHNTSASAGVNLGWTIFQGFNAVMNYKKLNELQLIGELNTQSAVEDFIAEITSEYYLYVQQIQLYKNLAYAVSLSRERVRIDEERYLLGAASKLQLLQSQVYLNSDSSRYTQQREVLRVRQVRINKLMAMDDLGQDLILLDSFIHINPNLIYDSLLVSAQRLNTSLQIARRNQSISAYDYRIVASRSYPYLNISAGYDFNLNEFESNTLIKQQSDGLSYGLTLGVNIFDGNNLRRSRANARIAMDNQEYSFLQIEQQVKADLITIYYGYQNNLLLLELEKENLKTAQENLQIALERYKLGSLSGLELREVQQSLLEAEERLLSVQYMTKLAEISLLQLSGKIMGYAGQTI
jgi:outer membrane protein TolC